MGNRICEQAAAVRAAIRTGRDDPAVHAHLARCDSCREEAAVTRWLMDLAAAPAEPTSWPDPRILWWKARLVERWDAERRAVEPVDAADRIQLGLGLAGCVVLTLWLRSYVASWAAQLPAADPTSWAAAAPTILTAVLSLAGIVAAATAVVAIRSMFAD